VCVCVILRICECHPHSDSVTLCLHLLFTLGHYNLRELILSIHENDLRIYSLKMLGVYSSSNLNQATYTLKSTAKYMNSVFLSKMQSFSVLMSLFLTGSHPSHSGGEIEKVSLSFYNSCLLS